MTMTKADWLALKSKLSIRNRAFIDGAYVDAASGEVFDCINPANGETLARIASCDSADVDRAVKAARAAFNDGRWSGKTPSERKAVLLKFAELMRRDLNEFALLESLDMGKLVSDAASIDVPGAAGVFQWFAEAIDKVYDEVAPTGPGNLALIRREALGVVGAVVPWNFPLDMAAWKCAPALALGNSVILKPAEQSPLTALRLGDLANEAGIPPGVFNVLPGYGEKVGKAMGLHPDIDCIAFTGSTEVGKFFLSYAGQSNMKQIWLECGGKSPNIIFADCEDLDAAADMAAFGIFFNQGEVCSANSRLLVQKNIAPAFIEKMKERAGRYMPGDPLDPQSTMGAIVDDNQAARIYSYIEHGKMSARLVAGGDKVTVEGKGAFISPTIFADVASDDRLSVEEIFGPVLAVTTFETEDEAVAIANASIYGLAASVWTSSLSRAHRMIDRLKVGTVSVNTVDALSPMTPFGGFKQSGIGRDLSLHAFDKYSGLKTAWIKY